MQTKNLKKFLKVRWGHEAHKRSGSYGKASACNAGDPGSIPGSGRSPAEGNGNPLQYPCLENSMDGGAWQATVHGVTKSRTRLSNFSSLQYNKLITFIIQLSNKQCLVSCASSILVPWISQGKSKISCSFHWKSFIRATTLVLLVSPLMRSLDTNYVLERLHVNEKQIMKERGGWMIEGGVLFLQLP